MVFRGLNSSKTSEVGTALLRARPQGCLPLAEEQGPMVMGFHCLGGSHLRIGERELCFHHSGERVCLLTDGLFQENSILENSVKETFSKWER